MHDPRKMSGAKMAVGDAAKLPSGNGCAILVTMVSPYLALSAWREIMARVFKDIPGQENASPAWLVNPATRRRLKLDLLYPDVGIAVRYVGLTAKGQGRQSDWEALEDEQRDQTRAEICRQHGVALCLVDPLEEPAKQMDALIRVVSRAARLLAQGDRPVAEKSKWQPRLSAARDEAEALRRSLARQPEQMLANLAESWRDRELGNVVEPAPPPKPVSTKVQRKLQAKLGEGRRVVHSKFGPGVITALNTPAGSNGTNAADSITDDTTVTILFDGEQERTFLLNLIYDKLTVEE